MVDPFSRNKSWSDNFLEEIITILQGCFYPYKFIIGELDEDRYECCDFKGIHKDKKDIIVSSRVRRYKFYEEYGNNLAISERVSLNGGKNEMRKIMDGYAQYYIYCFAHPDKDIFKIIDWKIYILDVFREWIQDQLWVKNTYPGERRYNGGDPNKPFRGFDMTLIPNVLKGTFVL